MMTGHAWGSTTSIIHCVILGTMYNQGVVSAQTLSDSDSRLKPGLLGTPSLLPRLSVTANNSANDCHVLQVTGTFSSSGISPTISLWSQMIIPHNVNQLHSAATVNSIDITGLMLNSCYTAEVTWHHSGYSTITHLLQLPCWTGRNQALSSSLDWVWGSNVSM